ncbi:hypothetical protein NDU88_005138 [Pleurodeles waltl]|uniref:Uncharacterized protein n=1 Tax=Pleurodeles waltl TaxID=8319 RepID=A0AAV7PEH9_PLEWA|nr:hypothetical protein NDU88_005138 [Pleurodeles waltl]
MPASPRCAPPFNAVLAGVLGLAFQASQGDHLVITGTDGGHIHKKRALKSGTNSLPVSMAPKHARLAPVATMTQVEFGSVSELWKMAKTHGVDWALQKLTEGPEKDLQLVAAHPLPKRQRKVPAYCRDASPDLGAATSTTEGS